MEPNDRCSVNGGRAVEIPMLLANESAGFQRRCPFVRVVFHVLTLPEVIVVKAEMNAVLLPVFLFL